MAFVLFISAAMIADAIGDMPIAEFPFVIVFTFIWAIVYDIVRMIKS